MLTSRRSRSIAAIDAAAAGGEVRTWEAAACENTLAAANSTSGRAISFAFMAGDYGTGDPGDCSCVYDLRAERAEGGDRGGDRRVECRGRLFACLRSRAEGRDRGEMCGTWPGD